MSILKIRWWQAFPYKWSNSCLQIGVLKAKLIIFSTELRDAFWLSNIVWAIPGTQKSNGINGFSYRKIRWTKIMDSCEGGSHLVRWPLRGAKKHPSGFIPSIWPKNVKLWLVISDRWPPKMGLQFREDVGTNHQKPFKIRNVWSSTSDLLCFWFLVMFFFSATKRTSRLCLVSQTLVQDWEYHSPKWAKSFGSHKVVFEKLRNCLWHTALMATRNPGFTHQVCELGSLSPFIYRVSVTSRVVVNAGFQPSTKRSSEHWLGKDFPKLLKFLPAIWFIGYHPESYQQFGVSKLSSIFCLLDVFFFGVGKCWSIFVSGNCYFFSKSLFDVCTTPRIK